MIVISRAAEDDLSVPVGFRFHPTDEELVTHYLKKKLKGMDSHVSNIIREIDILKFEPWDLPERSLLKSDDENWFFFSRPEYNKHKKNRTTQEGFWKITGREHQIKARDSRSVIGRKRILTFYRGRVRSSERTNWVMHEYYIPNDNPNAQRDFVLCRLKKNVKKSDENADVATCDEGEPSTHNASAFENQPVHSMESLEEDIQQRENPDYFERTMDRWLASSRSNNDHNATFADNDSESEFEEALRTLIPKPVHARVVGLQGRTYTSSPPMRDTEVILHNQLSRPAASPVHVAPKPQTSELQLQSGTSEGTHRPQPRSINVLRDTSAVNVDAFNVSINCIQLATDDEYYTKERTRRRRYPPVGKLREIKLQQSKAKEPEERRTSVDLPQKQISITKSSIDRKVAQGKNAEKDVEQTQNRTTPSNWKGSFITWQTFPLTSPPSVYICNTVLGAILFYFCVREWC